MMRYATLQKNYILPIYINRSPNNKAGNGITVGPIKSLTILNLLIWVH